MTSQTSNFKPIDYADDICLLNERISDISKMPNALNIHALWAGLKINIGKTKLISFPASERSIFIRHEEIENVDSFTYLGSKLIEGGGTMRYIPFSYQQSTR